MENTNTQNQRPNVEYVQCAASGLAFPVLHHQKENLPDTLLSMHSIVSITHLQSDKEAKWAKTFMVRLPNMQMIPITFTDKNEEDYVLFNHGGVYQSAASIAPKDKSKLHVKGEILQDCTSVDQGSPSAKVERSVLSDDDIISAYHNTKDALYAQFGKS